MVSHHQPKIIEKSQDIKLKKIKQCYWLNQNSKKTKSFPDKHFL